MLGITTFFIQTVSLPVQRKLASAQIYLASLLEKVVSKAWEDDCAENDRKKGLSNVEKVVTHVTMVYMYIYNVQYILVCMHVSSHKIIIMFAFQCVDEYVRKTYILLPIDQLWKETVKYDNYDW